MNADAGICLIAQGNLDAFRRSGIALARVSDLAPSKLVLAWRCGDDRPALRHLANATKLAVAATSGPTAFQRPG